MRQKTLLLPAVGLLALGALLGWSSGSMGQAAKPAAANCLAYKTNTKIATDLLVPGMKLPCAPAVGISGASKDPLDNLQHGFDLYSWLIFTSLNTPADGKTSILNGSGPTVWQNYKDLSDVMLENGQEPKAWDAPGNVPGIRGEVPKECLKLAKPGMMVIHIEEETFDQPFKSGPLVDQNGNYGLFDILMNKEMFDYIRTNKLYNIQGQRDFAQAINFPLGTNGSPTAPVALGAVMVKVSWKVLAANDDPKEFHTIQGLVYDDRHGPATCAVAPLGLVGFHVAHKTDHAPQWVWTTFEHFRNVPTQDDVDAHKLLDHYNFYNPKCDVAQCPVNRTPPRPWDPRTEPFPGGFHSQITRVIPQSADALNMDKDARAVLSGTVWKNYMLVSTQWPTNFASKTDPTGAPAPTYLPNATLETFSQGEIPLASSSCIACHNNATTHGLPATTSDFTYILEKAHDLVANATPSQTPNSRRKRP